MRPIRKIAFGYSSRCNLRCGHCVATEEKPDNLTMELSRAETLICQLAEAGVRGISFTAGEPLLHFNDLCVLLTLCARLEIYTRVVTNGFWAKEQKLSNSLVADLKKSGLSQLRISCSRWHQENVDCRNIAQAAQSCRENDLDYFISFITDFSEADDPLERFLRDQGLKFFPEPMIYAGRARDFERRPLFTEYQANCCAMNPYLAPDLKMYACCDAGSHFTNTDFFYLGNAADTPVAELFQKSDSRPLYNLIRKSGITAIASYAGMTARTIVTYRKCDLCKKLFDDPEMLARLEEEAGSGLTVWHR